MITGIYIQIDKGKAIRYGQADEEDDTLRIWWEIPRKTIKIGDGLGAGAFGEVKKGFLTIGNKTENCAVKMLKGKWSKYFAMFSRSAPGLLVHC